MSDIKNYLRESRSNEVITLLDDSMKKLQEEKLFVEFGKIGIHTTYAMIYNEDHSSEVVGYTFIKDLRYYKENVGKLKALQQALARKDLSENKK